MGTITERREGARPGTDDAPALVLSAAAEDSAVDSSDKRRAQTTDDQVRDDGFSIRSHRVDRMLSHQISSGRSTAESPDLI